MDDEPQRDRVKRPSRLLNLNKAEKKQREITARNAAESPLLRLTPELRVRIYDYVFGSTPVHIRSTEDWEYDEYPKHYELMRCEHPREHVEIPPRYIERVNISDRKRIPGCTIRPDDDHGKTLSGADINLGLLLVCRQIYQEAVLKPFTEIPFYFMVRWTDKGWPGLEGLAEDLAPPQLRAFKRLRIVLEHIYFGLPEDFTRFLGFGRLPDKKAMRKFTGLKDLQIVLNPQFSDEPDARKYIKQLKKHFVHDRNEYYSQSMSWLQALPDLRLNSIRLVVEAEICGEDRPKLKRLFPTVSSKGQTERIIKWLRKTELDLHFGEDVVRIDEPVLFGVKQDDDAIGIPPWATAEGLEEYLARPEEIQRARLEEEEGASSHSLTDTSDLDSDDY